MLILNFAPAPPISPAQQERIGQSILERLEFPFAPKALDVHVVEVPLSPTLAETMAAVPLTPKEWQTLPIAPRITADHPFAGALLAEVNRRRGYDWPVI